MEQQHISDIPQFTLGMLWALAALLNLPTLVAWTQNIQQGMNHTYVSAKLKVLLIRGGSSS